MSFLQRLAQVINSNGYANQVVVMAATDPLYGSVSAIMPPSNDGFDRLYTTLQAAVDSGAIVPYRGDEILVAPGVYDGTVTIPFLNTLTGTENGGFTITGLGNRGESYIEPSTAGAVGMTINANDVTLNNLGVAGDDTAAYALKVTGSRFRATGCKFELADGAGTAVVIGPGTQAQYDADLAGNGADGRFDDCEFCWATNGLTVASSTYGAATQWVIDGCNFHNISGTCLDEDDAGGNGSGRNIVVDNCVFQRMEDGTVPTEFVDMDSANYTGMVTNCSFELATNSASRLKIASGVYWVTNGTEAGVSAARPV